MTGLTFALAFITYILDPTLAFHGDLINTKKIGGIMNHGAGSGLLYMYFLESIHETL